MKFSKKAAVPILFLCIPFLLSASEFSVKVIETGDDLPKNFYRDWKKGDIFFSDGQFLILVGGSSRIRHTVLNSPSADVFGCIIAFAPLEKNIKDSLVVGAPNLRIDDWREYIKYDSVKPVDLENDETGLRFLATADVKNDKFQVNIQTVFDLTPNTGRIDLVSTIKNTGNSDIQKLDYDVYFSPATRYGFSPYNMMSRKDLNFRVYPKSKHAQAWVNLNPPRIFGTKVPGILKSGKSFTVRYALITRAEIQDLMRELYADAGTALETATLRFNNFSGNKMEVIIRDATSFSVFYRSFLTSTHQLELPLPEGAYTVVANFFPTVDQKNLSVKKGQVNLLILNDKDKGGVNISLSNSQGDHVPGKVTFIGLDPTKSPYFTPSDPILTGRGWETFKNSCYPSEEGLGVDLPVGAYLAYAARGPEYSTDQKIIEILSGEYQDLDFVIDKVIDTGNYISVDPHMHTQFSDGTVTIGERIRSVIAEGVNVAVSTDHNTIVDYSKVLEDLKMEEYLSVIAGCEVTTGGVIHYNSYPLIADPDKVRNGAIPSHSPTAGPLFDASRKQAPEALIQVNHPRTGRIGYFNNTRLDQNMAAFAMTNLDTNFDVMEIVNGASFYSANAIAINDWLHLLSRGYYFPLVGSSDAHTIDRGEPGYSRTYVMYDDPDEGNQSAGLNIPALIQAIKLGRSFTSNGPFVEIRVNGKYVQGDTFTAEKGRVAIWIKVQSAPWIDVSEVKLIINGDRWIVFNVKAEKDSIVKLDEEIGLTLKQDSYIAVEVMGERTLFPVMQRRSRSGGRWRASLPYALTNPVFVDVDGNGKFDPLWPGKVDLRSVVPQQKPSITRESYK